jgi:hypothetical protein
MRGYILSVCIQRPERWEHSHHTPQGPGTLCLTPQSPLFYLSRLQSIIQAQAPDVGMSTCVGEEPEDTVTASSWQCVVPGKGFPLGTLVFF